MVSRCCVFLVCGVAATVGLAVASERPVAVSPGSVTGSLVESRCPTFSWGAVPGAKSYELVVYRLGEKDEEPEPVLRQELPGSASGWTPSLDRCLKQGARYAWSVRATGKEATSEWSAPALFQVAAGPSLREFEEALHVVQQYVGDSSAGVSPRESRIASGDASGSSSSSAPQMDRATFSFSAAGGDSDLQVNGAAVVTTATFSAAIGAIELNCPGALGSGNRYTDCGNGTVRDNNTGLYWLKDASCGDLARTDADGKGSWFDGQSAAAGLADGTCGLTDGSQPVDWRQPTISELCSAWSGSMLNPCPSTAAPDSLLDSLAGPPTVAAGHPFVGLQTAGYWSSTEQTGGQAWFVSLLNAFVSFGPDTFDQFFVWPVRGGQ